MMQAMIFAAGLGTRLKPLTDRIPKALVSVGGEPLLKRVIFQLKDAGFTRIVVNVHHFSQQIIDYLRAHDNFGMDIRISDESEKLLETGGGIRKAWPLFNQSEPILIHNVDILSNVDLKKFYQMESRDMIAARLMVSERKTKRYLLFDDSMRLVGWTNIETGEVKSPYPDLNPKDYKMYLGHPYGCPIALSIDGGGTGQVPYHGLLSEALRQGAHRGICKERPQADGCGKAGDAERGGSIPEIVS